ncbi:hypothetical protein CVS40_1975, partial [Lucilia cuprina]
VITTAPVLVHQTTLSHFIVQCDASKQELAAVLKGPIYFYSKKLNKSQKNYSVTELECLAAVSAIKKFLPVLRNATI